MTKPESLKLEEMHVDIKWIKDTLSGHLKAHTTWTITIVSALCTVASGCLVYHFTH